MNTSVLLLLERYVKVASGALYTLLLAKFLGPELFGFYSANLAFAGLIGVFAFSGVDGLFQKKLSKNLNYNVIFKCFFIIKSVPVILAILMYLLWAYLNGDNEKSLLFFFLPFVFSLMLSFSYQGLIFTKKYKQIFIVSFSIILVSNIIRGYLFYCNSSIELFALSYSIEALLFPLGYSLFFFRKHGFKTSGIDLEVIKGIIRDGWPLVISTIIIGVLSKLALLKIESNSSLQEVGQFALVLRVVDAILIIAVASSMMNIKGLLTGLDTSNYKEVKRKYILQMYLLAITCSSLTFIFFQYLAAIFFGEEYFYTLTTSFFISLLVFFNFIGIYNGRLLVVEGEYKVALMRNVFSFVFFIILCELIIAEYNLEIATLTLSLYWMMSSFVFMLFSNKTRRMVFFERKK
jgi:O-antigen/teichoic acid export membrane protein